MPPATATAQNTTAYDFELAEAMATRSPRVEAVLVAEVVGETASEPVELGERGLLVGEHEERPIGEPLGAGGEDLPDLPPPVAEDGELSAEHILGDDLELGTWPNQTSAYVVGQCGAGPVEPHSCGIHDV